MTINLDETPMQSAQRAAAAISAFVAATAYRLGNSPHSVVSDAEVEAFATMRDALHELASHEYDRGFRRAVAMRKDARAALERIDTIYPAASWHEGEGAVAWWGPGDIDEAPYVGTPLDADFLDGHYVRWSRLHIPGGAA